MATTRPNFEESMNRLEEIVTRLEQGDRPLEETLVLFEEGTKLMKKCAVLLDKAEQKVLRLTQKADGSVAETKFDELERD